MATWGRWVHTVRPMRSSVILMLVLSGLSQGCLGNGTSCRWEGSTHFSGDTFVAVDQCSRCTCSEGTVSCDEAACAKGLTCKLNEDCAATELCQRPEGSCGEPGRCTARSAGSCPKPTPVCGCDGNTYNSSCEAQLAGANVASAGECRKGRSCNIAGVPYPDGSEGIPAADGCNTCRCTDGALDCSKASCGGATCSAGQTCGADQYCAFALGQLCGAADATAMCKPRPTLCTYDYNPVCGCDGRDHGNPCAANQAGTGVRSAGTCPVKP